MLLFDGGYVDFSGSEPWYGWYTRITSGVCEPLLMQRETLSQRMPYGEEMATLFIPDEVVPEGSEEEAQKPISLATAGKTRSTVMGDVRYLNQRNSVPSYRIK